MDNTQLAELLMGIARAQNAVVDAMERAQPGFRNNHVVPVLTVAANVRAATPRIQDLPSRILLRMQGRTPFDIAQIQRDFEAAVASAGSAIPDDPGSKIPPAAALFLSSPRASHHRCIASTGTHPMRMSCER